MSGTSNPRNSLFGSVDDLLRGRFTAPDKLEQGAVQVPVGRLLLACVLLGAISGACLGLFAVFSGQPEGWMQVGASALKVPLLFLLTLLITFPSLYVVSALARSRLGFGDTLKLLLISIAIHLALLASLGPVFVFFTLSTTSYAFMKLLTFGFFLVSGLVGVGALKNSLSVILAAQDAEDAVEVDPADETAMAKFIRERRPTSGDRAGQVLRVWILIYGVVGSQMGWILRPFIGSPDMEFSWFRDRESNIIQGVFRSFLDLFGAS